MRKYYNFEPVGPESADLNIYGEICNGMGWLYKEFGVECTDQVDFAQQLTAMGDIKTLNVYINSPGGDVFAAQTIHNLLKRHPAHVTVTVDGIAASAACIVVCAGDTVKMPLNAQMMFHDVMSGMEGAFNAEQLRAEADILDQIRNGIVAAYMTKSGKTEKELEKLMKGENWLTAKQAQAYGFVDEILYEQPSTIVNSGRYTIVNSLAFDMSKYIQRPPPDPTPELMLPQKQREHFYILRKKINS